MDPAIHLVQILVSKSPLGTVDDATTSSFILKYAVPYLGIFSLRDPRPLTLLRLTVDTKGQPTSCPAHGKTAPAFPFVLEPNHYPASPYLLGFRETVLKDPRTLLLSLKHVFGTL
jgi:hypothetical protein